MTAGHDGSSRVLSPSRYAPFLWQAVRMTDVAIQAEEEHHYAPDGTVVNSRLPLLVYRNAVQGGPDGDLVAAMKQTFVQRNDWLNYWTEHSVYPYPHFHSTAHEVLGVVRTMPLRLGGAGAGANTLLGRRHNMSPHMRPAHGVPGGAAHQARRQENVMMVGGYPEGHN